MKQHSINLITPEILERCRAGARTSRFIITGFILVAAMIATATHSRLVVESAESRHEMVTGRADRALVLEANVNEVKDQIEAVHEFMAGYREVALPLEATRIIATLTAALPPSVTLVELEMDYDDGRGPSRHMDAEDRGPRRLVGEITGIASSDGDIAELVQVLGARDPFAEVYLDYSRTRSVREQTARDFRLSFTVNLDQSFKIEPVETTAADASGDRP